MMSLLMGCVVFHRDLFSHSNAAQAIFWCVHAAEATKLNTLQGAIPVATKALREHSVATREVLF